MLLCRRRDKYLIFLLLHKNIKFFAFGRDRTCDLVVLPSIYTKQQLARTTELRKHNWFDYYLHFIFLVLLEDKGLTRDKSSVLNNMRPNFCFLVIVVVCFFSAM